MTARDFGLRISLTYALLMIGSGVQLPFLPLWLAAKGISVDGIAMIVAGSMATRILGAPLFAWIADHFGNRRLVIQLCAGFGFASYALLAISNGFGPIMTMALIATFMFAPVFPLTEGFSVDGAVAHGLDYGRLRMWASLSFLSGSLIAGMLLTQLDPMDTAWLIAAAQGCSLIATLLLPEEPEMPVAEKPVAELSRARDLFFGSSFPLLILVAGLGQASHGLLYGFSSVQWKALGFSSFGIGLLWTAGVLAEVGLLAFSGRFVERLGPGNLMLAGLSGGLLRWLTMAFVTNYPVLLAAQLLHACSFAMLHLGTMHMIKRMVPLNARNRAQGLYSAMSGGVFLSASVWMSGRLYGVYGSEAYLFMAGISVVALGLTTLLLQVSPRVRAAAVA